MNRIRFTWLAGLALLAAGAVALPAMASKASNAQPGNFSVTDDGKLFTSAALDKAKAAMNGAHFDHGLSVTIETVAEIPAGKKSAYSDEKKAAFFREWAGERATGTTGIFILVCRHPGYVQVLADKAVRARGFTHEDELKLQKMLHSGFADAAKETDETKQHELRDAALQSAISFVISDLQGTTIAGGGHTAQPPGKPGGSLLGGIGGLLCLGVVVLLAVWLVIGVIRAFTGGGGGMGGGGMGGGGGGFMTSLFGGLFGAMAGMWLYNNLFGHGGMFGGGGSDAYASEGYGSADGDAPGAGDYSGDAGAGGGWDDGGGFGGGGDWGGGGGDMGGGGDF
ncbi:MAG: hypothetical protein U0791_17560 [Gemmataceae bacterium]